VTARGLIVGLALLAACGVATRVDLLGPDFEGTRTLRMRGNVLPTPVDGIGAIELNAERVERPERPHEYALLVEVRAEGLRIRPGHSLRLVMDGDTIALARDSVATSWPRVDPTVQEQARYATPDSVMLRLGAAEAVRIGVRGAGWWEARRLSAENLETLRGFVRLYVTPDSAASADTTAGP
jgi:hypothetical protein